MNVLLTSIAIGSILMALGLVMAANRGGYVYFVVRSEVGPRLAAVVGVLEFWVLEAARGQVSAGASCGEQIPMGLDRAGRSARVRAASTPLWRCQEGWRTGYSALPGPQAVGEQGNVATLKRLGSSHARRVVSSSPLGG